MANTLLIVDDEPVNPDVLQPYYRVRAANSGKRALQAAQGSLRSDLILFAGLAASDLLPAIGSGAIMCLRNGSRTT